MENPILNHQEYCRKLAPPGWEYVGWVDGFYSFQSGNYKDGFTEMLLLECDLTEDNIAFMVENKFTRIEGFDYGEY